MVSAKIFTTELQAFQTQIKKASRILLTAPGAADGDSIGAQLALQRMFRVRYPEKHVYIVNDEALPPRYQFLNEAQTVFTPETFLGHGNKPHFDMGILVDGGIDRAGRVKAWYDGCESKVFIDHHAVSCDYPYTIRLVDPSASATTEIIYHISQTDVFQTPIEPIFAQHIYLGLIFDTGFFRHGNTTPEVMELGANLLRTGFDFTRLGERGMLERSFDGLKLMSETITRSELRCSGRIIWSTLTQEMLNRYRAVPDDREGIIDHLFLTHGVDVALLLFELPNNQVKVSLRSQGAMDVATFARELSVCGGGHTKAAGALMTDISLPEATSLVLSRLERSLP